MLDYQATHPVIDARFRKHERAGMPHDRHRGGPVVIVGALPLRGVNDQFVLACSDQARRELFEVGLDAATAGGKSLVTRRTLVIASDTLAGQPALPLGLQSVQVDPERLADRGGQIAVARAAGRHVQGGASRPRRRYPQRIG